MITIIDLLLRYQWLVYLLPRLSEQIEDLIEAASDYELTNEHQYIERVCALFPRIFESFCTFEDRDRRENLVTNCFSLTFFNNSNTIALLEIMANNCDTRVYDLCDKLTKAHRIFERMSFEKVRFE